MTMRAPWAVDVADASALTLLIVTGGRCRIEAGGAAHDGHPGDVVLVRGPDPYRVSDAGGSAPIARIEPGQRCITPDGRPLHLRYAHGLRHWGNDPDGPDTVIVASYPDTGSVGRFVTDVLPDLVFVPAGRIDAGLVTHLVRELGRDGLGQSIVLDRLIDIVTIEAIRAWAAEHPPVRAPWLAGVTDPAVATALDAMHSQPEQPWTVAALARIGTVSRATLAERFTRLVGQPPLRYLARWRLALARDLMVDPALTLDAIAKRVGYSSGFALSAAFSREYGHSPAAHRRRLAEPARIGG
jgi:AraC-like DNA-binding protein